jgi:hypothetical protein
MGDKGISQSFCVIVDIFAEEEHNSHPDIIRGDLDVAVIDVGFKESSKKSIFILLAQRTALFIRVDFLDQILPPKVLST